MVRDHNTSNNEELLASIREMIHAGQEESEGHLATLVDNRVSHQINAQVQVLSIKIDEWMGARNPTPREDGRSPATTQGEHFVGRIEHPANGVKKNSHQLTAEIDKVRLAAFHMLDEAQLWAQSNPLGDLVLLRQIGNDEHYQKLFQEKLARANKIVRVDQQVGLCTVGLTESLSLEVELLAPPNLARTMNLARTLEAKQKIQSRRPIWKGGRSTAGATSTGQPWHTNVPAGAPIAPKPSPSQPAFIIKLNRAEMEEPAPEVEEPAISLHAIMDLQSTKTMQICDMVNAHPLLNLVDSSSTYNFLSFTAAQQLQLHIQPQPIALVLVANGEKERLARANQFVSHTQFVHNFTAGLTEALRLEVELHAPSDLDHTMNLARPIEHKQHVLKESLVRKLACPGRHNASAPNPSYGPPRFRDKIPPEEEIVETDQEGLEISLHAMTCLCSSSTMQVAQVQSTNTCKLSHLLTEFEDIFQVPTALQPIRHCDHRIRLKTGTEPVMVHPYRYPHLLKDETERQCQQMLAQCQQMLAQDVEKTVFLTHHSHFEFLVMPFGLSNAPSTFQALMNEVDQSTIQVVTDWPIPTSIKALRGFLGLAGYYKKIIHSYGQLEQLKDALSSTPVLQLPDFDESCLAAYERELIGLAKAIQHWCPYLWGRSFLIRTDHCSLKYHLEQRLTTSPQQHWLSKLMGFDFSVKYKLGSLNVGADALSCRDVPESQLNAISQPRALLLDSIREETCQRNKAETLSPAGLLQPLQRPSQRMNQGPLKSPLWTKH
ncbi:uncharacterized protein [Aristolochia californica]|uniref:uncharacterized protein n=1 Tax=Aristolochia californica TaxID=171875 RepID=UPI0035DEFC06